MMMYDFVHLTKCCWNGRDGRYFDSISKQWYKKDYPRYYGDVRGTQKELVFAFFDFESALNLNLTKKTKEIDVWCITADRDVGNRKKIIVGMNKVLEYLLK
ncbi:MAG: hypothetical protein II411_06050 [Lachnospiraceae bacterium]|nr:hypothetical protein [Lachnospiraceae bacterium]